MRQTALWPRCAICRHRVNPRSEICERHHPMCTPTGCQVIPESWPRVAYDPATEPAARTAGLPAPPRAATRTVYLIDLASYQQGIDLAAVKAAGFTAVNIKLTQGNWYTWAQGKFYADWARQLGLTVLSFSWLDNSASGTVQAAYAYRQYQVIGAVGHQCDCEDSARPASWQTWVDYIRYWQARAPVCNYSGDWWWPPHMGERGAEVCPLLWAAPNNGYLTAYPGDTSPAWHAGYGGWVDYALLQYAVQPITGAGGGNLSKTAIRDPAVWAALTGEENQMAISDADWAQVRTWVKNTEAAVTRMLRGMDPIRDITYPDGTEVVPGGIPNIFTAFHARMDAAVAADQARDQATKAAIDALSDVIRAGGGDVDTAGIIAAIQAAAAESAATAERLLAELAEAAQREQDLRAKLAAAYADTGQA